MSLRRRMLMAYIGQLSEEEAVAENNTAETTGTEEETAEENEE